MEETNTTPKGVSMKKILVSLAAAAVLVVGVATTAVITGSSADAQEAPDSDSAPAVDRPEPGSAVQEVLDDLVAANEITQAQADTIFAALQEKREELKANRPEGGHGRGSRRGAQFSMNLAELLEDGVMPPNSPSFLKVIRSTTRTAHLPTPWWTVRSLLRRFRRSVTCGIRNGRTASAQMWKVPTCSPSSLPGPSTSCPP